MVSRTAFQSAIHALVFALVLSGCGTVARKLNPGGPPGKDTKDANEDDAAAMIGEGHFDDGHYMDEFGGHGDDYDVYSDFNVSARLEVIFPLMDVDGDGVVSQEELKLWHEQQGLNSSKRRAKNEFEGADQDHDGFVTLKEYLEDDFDRDVNGTGEFDEMQHYNIKWIKNTRKTFHLADKNKDDKLDEHEFYVFIHPEEGGKGELTQHLISQDVHDHDLNSDHKLDFKEFFEGMYNELEVHEEPPPSDEAEGHEGEEHKDEHHEDEVDPSDPYNDEARKKKAKELFDSMDTDKDGILTPEEIHAHDDVLKKLHPTEAEYAKDQAKHLVGEADANKDGKLTLSEMQDNAMAFYATAMSEEDSYYHDELR